MLACLTRLQYLGLLVEELIPKAVHLRSSLVVAKRAGTGQIQGISSIDKAHLETHAYSFQILRDGLYRCLPTIRKIGTRIGAIYPILSI